MDKKQFNDVQWHRGMQAEIEVRTITCGTIRKIVTIVGVDFETERVTVSYEGRRITRSFDNITLIGG